MNIFIVEDSPVRIDIFKEKFKDIEEAKLFIATTAEEGKKIIDDNEGITWDMLFLDHDLGGRVYVESADKNTGYQVAKYIKEKECVYYNAVTHSLNPAGAQNIMDVLENCNHIPFTILSTMEFSY